MRQTILFGILLLTVPLTSCQEPWVAQNSGPLPPIEIYFSPNGGCTAAVVKEIAAAKESILLQAYSFTSAPIAKALVEAHKRGVQVQAMLDKSQKSEKYSEADFLIHAGIATKIDDNHAIAHNKVMILDGQVVITGSFNFTKSAEESNAENLLVIRDRAIADKYVANWQKHAQHSEPYAGSGSLPDRPASQPRTPPAARTNDLVGAAYVASKNSQVFHKAACPSAAKISDKNLLQFQSRNEATAAGKNPCPECKP